MVVCRDMRIPGVKCRLGFFVVLLIVSLSLLVSVTTQAIEGYVDIGVNYHSVSYDTRDQAFDANSQQGSSLHLGLGVLNQYGYSQRNYFGFGVEAHQLLGDNLIALRALNYQYQLYDRVRLGGYLGAVQLDSGASQTGFYFGSDMIWQNVFANLDVSVGLRVSDKLQRDRFFDDDPVDASGRRSDFFLRLYACTLLLHWRF